MSSPTSIRKAAILVSILDSRNSDALLEQMEPELAQRVRDAVMDLDEISPREQQEVMAEFLGQPTEMDGSVAPDDGVELSPHLAERLASDSRTHQRASEPPFHFLRDADPALLARHLQPEHPQTIAVVIAHLPPEQAAEVLQRLPAELSTEALRRMAWLDELSPEVIEDLERELKAALLPKLRAPEAKLRGLASVQAVLAALGGSQRSAVLEGLARRDERLVRQLGYGENVSEFPSPTPQADVTSFRFRLEPAARAGVSGFAGSSSHQQEASAIVFDDLGDLDDRGLKQIFAATEMSVLVLALTGADDRLTRRILRQLSSSDAAILRTRLSHPGPLRLRDIEVAQRAVVRIACRLAESGELVLPVRGFAAAA